MITWPSALVDALARRRAIIFVGAGISAASKDPVSGMSPPAWTELLKEAASRCVKVKSRAKRLVNAGDLLTACELIKSELAEDWRTVISDKFLAPYKPNKNHEHIHSLGQQIIITPNFDKIYDRYVESQSSPVIVKWERRYEILSDVRAGRNLVLKVHGSIDHPESIILTRSDYARARIDDAQFFRVLDALLLLNTTVFLGCGLADPDIQLILENQALAFKASQPHYFVTAAKLTDGEIKMFHETRNIRIIRYNPRGNHAELTESLNHLVEQVNIERKRPIATAMAATP